MVRMGIIWISLLFLVGFLTLFLFASCKVSSRADEEANYLEEYGEDLYKEDDL